MIHERATDVLKDGVYELTYRAEAEPDGGCDSLLVALRNGTILGSDRWGGVFLGRCEFDRQTHQHRVKVRLQVPPGGMLVTDDEPREAGAAFDIAVAFSSARDMEEGSGLVELGGQQVRVGLLFKGPVPR